MEALFFRAVALATLALSTIATTTLAGNFRSKNFIVSAPTPAMAQQIGQAAEKYRRELAIEWLGKEMPTWGQPCPIRAQVSPNLGAGGATSFRFDNGEVFDWEMSIQGSFERILDSVLPHEVTHTIFATHFRQPLPRWADEGACTTVEHVSERNKQQRMLVEFLQTGRGIAFSKMFAMRDYPADVMPLYSQGYSLARFLIAQGGKKKFIDFVADGLADNNWQQAVDRNYQFTDLGHLQDSWLDWVRQGSPAFEQQPRRNAEETPVALASNERRARTVAAASRETHIDAYPTDDSEVMVPVRKSHEIRAASASKSSNATWHPAKHANSSLDESVTAEHDAYGSAETTPGPSTAESTSYQVTRAQTPERAKQIILEWSK